MAGKINWILVAGIIVLMLAYGTNLKKEGIPTGCEYLGEGEVTFTKTELGWTSTDIGVGMEECNRLHNSILNVKYLSCIDVTYIEGHHLPAEIYWDSVEGKCRIIEDIPYFQTELEDVTCQYELCEGDKCGQELTELRVWAISDTHFDDTTLEETWVGPNSRIFDKYDWETVFSERLDDMQGKYDLGLHLGDIVLWRNDLNEITKVDNILTDKGLNNKFITITGNHEVIHTGTQLVGDYYIQEMSPTGTHNFAWEYGNLLFVMMGNEIDSTYTDVVSLETVQWFNDVVITNPDKIIIVVAHPSMSKSVGQDGAFGRYNEMLPIMENENIDIWIHGHSHVTNHEVRTFGTNEYLDWTIPAWECSPRACYLQFSDIGSGLMKFTHGSDIVRLDHVVYSGVRDTTGESSPYQLSSYQLSQPVDLFPCGYVEPEEPPPIQPPPTNGGGGGGGGASYKECYYVENGTCEYNRIYEWYDCEDDEFETLAICEESLVVEEPKDDTVEGGAGVVVIILILLVLSKGKIRFPRRKK